MPDLESEVGQRIIDFRGSFYEINPFVEFTFSGYSHSFGKARYCFREALSLAFLKRTKCITLAKQISRTKCISLARQISRTKCISLAKQISLATGEQNYFFWVFIPFLESEMRLRFRSTSLMRTSITSPTEKRSEGCLMYLSDISEMWSSPSW